MGHWPDAEFTFLLLENREVTVTGWMSGQLGKHPVCENSKAANNMADVLPTVNKEYYYFIQTISPFLIG